MKNYLYGMNNCLGADKLSLKDSVYKYMDYSKKKMYVLEEDIDDINSSKTLKHFDQVKKANEDVFSYSDKLIKEGYRPILFGGDHSISIGTISAASNNYEDLNVLWIDAHADINDENTSPSGNIHGMPLSFLLGYGNEKLANLGGFNKKIKTENIMYIGLRSVDEGEKKIIEEKNIKAIYYNEVEEMGIDRLIEEINEFFEGKNLHISFDFDSMDPKIFPAVSTPVPNGFTKEEIEKIFKWVISKNKVVSFDFVEFNASNDIDDISLKYADKLVDKVYKLLENE